MDCARIASAVRFCFHLAIFLSVWYPELPNNDVAINPWTCRGEGRGGDRCPGPPPPPGFSDFFLEYKTSAPDVFTVAVRSSLAQFLGRVYRQLLWLRDMTS